MELKTFSATLIDSYFITKGVKHFVFQIDKSKPFSYIPGQFITIHFEHQTLKLRRSYSIANIPNTDNIIEFAASYIENGPGTTLLYHLKAGDTLIMSGPYGRLILKESNPQRYIFIGTSTGITPYRAMLDALLLKIEQNPEIQVIILQGVSYQEDILYESVFREFAAKNLKQITFIPCLSREKPELVGKDAHAGRVLSILSQLNLDPTKDLVYLCGNPSMIDDTFTYLENQGFATQQIIREKYLSR